MKDDQANENLLEQVEKMLEVLANNTNLISGLIRTVELLTERIKQLEEKQ